MGIPLILGAEILYKIEGPLLCTYAFVENLAISSLQAAASYLASKTRSNKAFATGVYCIFYETQLVERTVMHIRSLYH